MAITQRRQHSYLLWLFPWMLAAAGLVTAERGASAAELPGLDLQRGDTIVIVGNTLAERMAMAGYWEPLLQTRFPELQLKVRNLGWSADEVALRPRSKDFDQHGHTLHDHKPDLVLAMFGLNESFAGREGLGEFRDDLRRWARRVTTTAYNGQQPPHIVLCSPIPHEDLGDPHLPDGGATNAHIELYSRVMAEVAAETERCSFVDLYGPLLPAMEDPQTRLTTNGIHLNDAGNRRFAEVLDVALFGEPPQRDPTLLSRLRTAVQERNQQFYYDYRAVNGYYIYGGRKNPYGVINFPEEFAKLRKMIANRDQRIWDIAAGRPVPEMIDDSNTGELSPIRSNVQDEIEVSTPAESAERFVVPEGFRVELVASEVEFPDLQNPVAFEFDNRGRLWVSTMPSYPMYLPGTPPNDKLLILEDTDGDGRMDKQTVFAEGLHLPIGFALGDGGAYVSQQPNLLFLEDTDGDDRADRREIVLHGFDSADSHHSISAFTWGPGGALYFQEGTFHHTQVETPYGPRRVKDAGIFRYEPKTERFDVFVSYPFANPWGHCFDRWGQNFVADASGGANYYGTAFSGDVIYPNKRRGMQQFLVKQWRPTCGCLIVSSRQFPETMQGNYLLNNTIGFLGTLQYRMRETGSGFAADPVEPLLRSEDPNFRPVDLTFGPDGALYLVDWFNPLIGHMQHSLRDPKRDKQHGRIWRVRYAEKPLLQPPEIAGEPVENLVPLLGAYEDATRAMARNELRLHPTEQVLEVLDVWLSSLQQNPDPGAESIIAHAQLEALWVRQHHDAVDRAALLSVLRSPEPRARAAATRVLCYWRDRIADAVDLLVAAAGDVHPRVRLEAVRAASFLPAAEGRRVVAEAMRHPLDDYLNYTIGETTTTLDRRGGGTSGGDDAMVARLSRSLVPQTQLVGVVEVTARSAGGGQLAGIVEGVLQGPYESAIQANAMRKIVDAAAARKLQVPVDSEIFGRAFATAIEGNRVELVAVLAEAAGDWQVSGMEPALRAAVFSETLAGEAVQAALSGLTHYATPTANDALSSLRRQPIPVELRLRAAAALAQSRSGQALQLLRAALAENPEEYELVRLATGAWLSKRGGPAELRRGLAEAKLPEDAAKLMLRAVVAAGGEQAELVELLTERAGLQSQREMTASERTALIADVESRGDAAAGQWVYRRPELQCAQCHALSGAGGNIGPDLSGVGATSPVEYLLDSILKPSQQIKEAYATINVLTVSGQITRGVQVNRDDDRLVLRDAEGKEVTISIEDIEAESPGLSLMPAGLHHQMTRRELIDLVAFLAQLGKPGPFAVNTRPTLQRYQLLTPAAAQALTDLEEGALETRLLELPEAAWESVYALVDGRLPLSEFATVERSGPLVLQGEFDVVVPGEVAIEVQPAGGVQLILDGRSLAPHGRETRKLSAGRHRLHLIYEGGDAPEMVRAEVVRPPDSEAQLTIVGGP